MTIQLSNELRAVASFPETAVPAVAAPGRTTSPFVLTVACPERPGIVHAVSSFLAGRGFDISEHQQFDDHVSGTLFLRTAFNGARGSGADAATAMNGAAASSTAISSAAASSTADSLAADFATVADEFGMTFRFHDDSPQRILVMVSKFGHCLNDLIFRWRAGSLGADLVAVVSNHETLRPMAEAAGLPFIHVPVTAQAKPEAERRMLELVDEYQADLVVLARYMQVLSDELCGALRGRAINIHHSFLPGFKGAKPYHQAYERGVKVVGATAHYITAELDEGPIIEQEVFRVDHGVDPESLVTAGRDAEAMALSRAVKWHCQHRVLLNNSRTVVFR